MYKKIIIAILLLTAFDVSAMEHNPPSEQWLQLALYYMKAYKTVESNRPLFINPVAYDYVILSFDAMYEQAEKMYNKAPSSYTSRIPALEDYIQHFKLHIQSCSNNTSLQHYEQHDLSTNQQLLSKKTVGKKRSSHYEPYKKQSYRGNLYTRAINFFEKFNDSTTLHFLKYSNNTPHQKTIRKYKNLIIDLHKAYEEIQYRCAQDNTNTTLVEHYKKELDNTTKDMILLIRNSIICINRITNCKNRKIENNEGFTKEIDVIKIALQNLTASKESMRSAYSQLSATVIYSHNSNKMTV